MDCPNTASCNTKKDKKDFRNYKNNTNNGKPRNKVPTSEYLRPRNQRTLTSQGSRSPSGVTLQQQQQINNVIRRVESMIKQKMQGGRFNVNVNQLETAIYEAIGPEGGSPMHNSVSRGQQQQFQEEEKVSEDSFSQVANSQTRALQRSSNQMQSSLNSSEQTSRNLLASHDTKLNLMNRNQLNSEILISRLATIENERQTNETGMITQQQQPTRQMPIYPQKQESSVDFNELSTFLHQQLVSAPKNSQNKTLQKSTLKITNINSALQPTFQTRKKVSQKPRIEDLEDMFKTDNDQKSLKQPIRKSEDLTLNDPIKMFYNDKSRNFFALLEKLDNTLYLQDTFDASSFTQTAVDSRIAFKISDLIQHSSHSPSSNKFQQLSRNVKNLNFLQQSYTQDHYDFKGSPQGSGRRNLIMERDNEIDEYLLGDKQGQNGKYEFHSQGDYSRQLSKVKVQENIKKGILLTMPSSQSQLSRQVSNDTRIMGSLSMMSKEKPFNFGKRNPAFINARRLGTGQNKEQHHRIISISFLQEQELLFLEKTYYKSKQVQKSLLKSLTGQVNAQQIRKQGVMIEEAQLADSILYLYWKQKMAKQYYIFSRGDIIDRTDLQLDDDKIEDYLLNLKVDIKYSIKEELSPTKKSLEYSLNDVLNQLELDFPFFPEQYLSWMLLDARQTHYFPDIEYRYSGETVHLDENLEYIKRPCLRTIILIINNDLFNGRLQKLIDNYQFKRLKADSEKKAETEKKIQQAFSKYKRNNFEQHNELRNFIFQKAKQPASEIVKTLFQHKGGNIFRLLIDKDEDYDLQLTIDTLVALAQQKELLQRTLRAMKSKNLSMKTVPKNNYNDSNLLKVVSSNKDRSNKSGDSSRSSRSLNSSNVSKKQSEILSMNEHDFLPVVRKGALRRNFQYRRNKNPEEIQQRSGSSRRMSKGGNGGSQRRASGRNRQSQVCDQSKFLLERIKNTRNFSDPKVKMNPKEFTRHLTSLKRNRGRVMYENSVTSSDSSYQYEEFKSEQEKDDLDHSLNKSKDQDEKGDTLLKKHLQGMLVGQIENPLLTVPRKTTGISIQLKNYPKRFSSIQGNDKANQFIQQFGYDCFIEIDEDRKFWFEVYYPQSQSDSVELQEKKKTSETSSDTLKTDMSMRDQIDDKFVDFDAQIQKQQLKKFLQNQKLKKGQLTYNNKKFQSLLDQKQSKDDHSAGLLGMSGITRDKKQSLVQLQNYTTIGDYYRNLSKKKKEEVKDDQAAEVVSADEYEDDHENFYQQMQNNIQIMELLKDIGSGKQHKSSHSKDKDLFRKRKIMSDESNFRKTEKGQLNNMNLSDDGNGLGSLFSDSSDSIISKKLESCKSLSSRRKSTNVNNNSENKQFGIGTGNAFPFITNPKIQRMRLTLRDGIKTLIETVQLKKERKREKREKIHKATKYFQNTDFLKRNLYMIDQGKFERQIIQAVYRQNAYNLKEILPKFDLSLDNYTDQLGNTLLIVSTQFGSNDCVKLLLQHGSNPNKKNNMGNVPLHYSIKYGFNKITDTLIMFGADESLVNNNGRSPWEGFE